MMELTLDIKINDADPALIGIDQLASAVRRLSRGGAPFTVREVCGKANSLRFTIARDFLLDLVARGHAEDLGYQGLSTPGNRTFRLLVADERVAAPEATRAGVVRQQIWNILCSAHGRDRLSAADLVMLASTEAVPVSAADAGRYMNALAADGYVMLVPQRRPKSWRFIQSRKSGPLAPVPLVAQLLYDPNRHVLASSRVAAEEVTP